VTHIGPEGVNVSFHNAGAESASFIIQGGCFGEHEIVNARIPAQNQVIPVHGKYLAVKLLPGEGAEMHLELKRFFQKPGYQMPNECAGTPTTIRPRQIG